MASQEDRGSLASEASLESQDRQVPEESLGRQVRWDFLSKVTAERMGHLGFLGHLASRALLAFQGILVRRASRDRLSTDHQVPNSA